MADISTLLQAIAKKKEPITKQYEGFRPTIYKDTKGNKTIGYGFNIFDPYVFKKLPEDITSGKRPIKKEEADIIFNDLYSNSQKDAVKWIGKETYNGLSPERQEVVNDMSYNLGRVKLSKFKKLRKALQAGDYDKAAEEMKDSDWYGQVKNRAKENIRRMEKTKGRLKLSMLQPDNSNIQNILNQILKMRG